MKEAKNKNLTAAQRLEGLEASLNMLDQGLGNMTVNLQAVIDAVTLISKKVEAIVRIGNAGGTVNSETIAAEIISINAEELKSKIDKLVKEGVAVASSEVKDNSFIVGRELNPETKDVSNVRIQFPMYGLKQEIKDKLSGKKIGDIVSLEEGRNLLEITELFDIVVPSAPAQTTEETANGGQ